ncbi:alpha/beta hydrolase [Pleionea sp. CnH1-48]|uniref:alpha/beta hydrolase n=1 Tax=Pleionea sp. CnH1-48 TaxID=2954494 RepID=UPI002096FB1C|nr:alpha/beta fold hydrolase [Pleionea sp. CnH1-48]MCO7223199.1 alpha/beta hydrolase [Pleionea sp. CnH1-48]
MKKLVTSIALISAFGLMTPFADGAVKKSVSFKSNGQTLAGDLYLPDTYKDGQKLPAVIVTGSWTSVKEQMAGGYAQELADRGYAALAFDFRGWGASGGDIKFVENPTEKTKDIVAAADFLAQRPEVNPVKVGALGICASAGYATDAALQSKVIKAVAVVAPWYHDAEIVAQVYGEHVKPLLAASRAAKSQYQKTGQSTIVPAASIDDKSAVMQGEGYYTDTKRGAISSYDNQFNVMTWEPWLTYDAIKTAALLEKPTLLIHSEAAAIPQGVKKYIKQAGNRAKSIWLEGITQFDFYDGAKPMKIASDEVAKHFSINL